MWNSARHGKDASNALARSITTDNSVCDKSNYELSFDYIEYRFVLVEAIPATYRIRAVCACIFTCIYTRRTVTLQFSKMLQTSVQTNCQVE